jgi:drug/metabolite transporter (DMT)-like permease
LIGIFAALIAVLLWSSKPLLLLETGDALTPGQVFMLSATLSVLSSVIPVVILRRRLREVLIRIGTRNFLSLAACSAAPLSVWYWAFYHALSAGAPAEAVVISFTWPMIAILAMRVFARGLSRPLRRSEYPLLLLAFFGASVTAYGAKGENGLIWYAILAAIGSGLYLPFMVRLIKSMSDAGGGPVFSSFVSVSAVNTLTVPIATALLIFSGEGVVPDGVISFDVMMAVGVIGIGILLISEMLWSWGVMRNGSAAITALPYFTPILSALLLALIGQQDLGSHVIIGAGIVLVSNLLIHLRRAPASENKKN